MSWQKHAGLDQTSKRWPSCFCHHFSAKSVRLRLPHRAFLRLFPSFEIGSSVSPFGLAEGAVLVGGEEGVWFGSSDGVPGASWLCRPKKTAEAVDDDCGFDYHPVGNGVLMRNRVPDKARMRPGLQGRFICGRQVTEALGNIKI